MTKHFCDKCKKEANGVFTYNYVYDLCRDCDKQYKIGLESIRSKHEEEEEKYKKEFFGSK